MKRVLFSLLLFLFALPVFAHHIVGGEMIYQYLGPGAALNTKKYSITLKLFRDENCTAPCAPMPVNVFIGIYNRDNNSEYNACPPTLYCNVPQSDEQIVPLNPFPPCISNPPSLSYHVGFYTFTVDLPDNAKGYTVSYQTCCRVDDPMNVYNPSGSEAGSTYTTDIPAVQDDSPVFDTKVDVICQFKKFTLDFASTDADGDSLVYSFADAYNTSDPSVASSNINPTAPPYKSLQYINGYSAFQPLGTKASINSQTGIISGIAPAAGAYVVCVEVRSYRNGVFVAAHRKDFIVNIGTCDFSGAALQPSYLTCDGFSLTFINLNTSAQNQTFFWDFGVAGRTDDTSNLPNPTFNYPDTGMYVVKLVVNGGQPCADSATTIAKVYPGFFPGFIFSGQCKNTQIQFTDTTRTNYGSVNSWAWNFDDPSTTADTSHQQNPKYTFNTSGNYNVSLLVTNSKGCADTVSSIVAIKDKPDLSVTNDTLICAIDTLQLVAIGNGTIFWTPNYNINDQNNSSPLVSPKSPTIYYATLTDPSGCKATDSVFVNVKQFVTIDAGPDAGICQGDTITLNAVSDALHFIWSPSAPLDNNTLQSPVATPLATTTFYVVGNIGKCQSTDSVRIKVTALPGSNPKQDTGICLGNSIQLNVSGGSIYKWTPPTFLNDANIPDPIANPNRSMQYIVTVHDTLGCDKPVFDTVIVNVQNIIADAGPRDTSIVVNQPLQLNATGAEFYLWSPSTGLNASDISNPLAIFNDVTTIDYVVKVSSAAGCFDTDTITVRVYKVLPGLYIPNAFTPNGDGVNDYFRPIAIGMKQINYFKIFSRWGQLIYSSTNFEVGWNGTFKGKPQDPAVYVWIVEGIDYQNKRITQKGTVTLIR